jgi:hypothetical protein
MTLHHFFNITTLHRYIYIRIYKYYDYYDYYYYWLLLLYIIQIDIYIYISLSLSLSITIPQVQAAGEKQIYTWLNGPRSFPVEFLEFPRSQGSPYHPHLAATLVVHLGIHMWHGSWAAEKLEDTNRVHKEDGDLMVIYWWYRWDYSDLMGL